MSLDIGAALREGVGRVVSRQALPLLVVFLVLSVTSVAATQTLNVAAQEALLRAAEANPDAFGAEGVDGLRTQLETTRQGAPLAFGVPAAVAAAVALLLGLVAEAATLVAVRLFVADRGTSLGEHTSRLGGATLNGFVGGIVVGALVALGTVALVVPGVFLYVSFLFLRQEIAIGDRNFVDAMARSWERSRGNRFGLFGLAVVVLTVSLVGFLPGVVLTGISPLIGTLVGAVVSPFVTLFGVAPTSRADAQLLATDEEGAPVDDDGDGDGDATDDEDDPYAGPLGPDDLPEP
jgi:hypothetical protein